MICLRDIQYMMNVKIERTNDILQQKLQTTIALKKKLRKPSNTFNRTNETVQR